MPHPGGLPYAFPRIGDDPSRADTREMRSRAWWAYLLLMAPIVGLYLFGPSLLNSGPVFNAIGLSAVAAIVVGVGLHRPHHPLAWYLFAAGQAMFVGGDVLAYNYERFFGHPLPFPSIADVVYLGVFPSLIVGLLLLIRRRKRGADWASLIDSVVITTGVGLLSWVFLIAPYAHDATLSASVKLTAIAYPLMDVLLLSVAVRLAFAGGNRTRATFLVVLSICVLFVTDGIYGWLQLHAGSQPGSLLDGGWILFYLLFGAAALHPSMAAAEESAAARPRLTRTRLAMLTVATFVAPVVGLLGPTGTSDRAVIAGCAVVVFGLVLVRMVGLVRRQEAEAGRLRALEQTTARLQELDRLKDQFVATVSHELRTPLTSIHGYLELVLDGGAGSLEAEQRQFLSVVARNTHRLRRLVDDLLLVSEIDAGNLVLHLDDLDLGTLARESLESSRVPGGGRWSQPCLRVERPAPVAGRQGAARPTPRQRRLERAQVHAARRQRLRPREQIEWLGSGRGRRHRHRDSRRRAGAALRPLLPGACRDRGRRPGNRPRALDLPGHCKSSRRLDRRRERDDRRHDVPHRAAGERLNSGVRPPGARERRRG